MQITLSSLRKQSKSHLAGYMVRLGWYAVWFDKTPPSQITQLCFCSSQRHSSTQNLAELFVSEWNVPHLRGFLRSAEVAAELWSRPLMMAAVPLFASPIVISAAREQGCSVGEEIHRQMFMAGEHLPTAAVWVKCQPSHAATTEWSDTHTENQTWLTCMHNQW